MDLCLTGELGETTLFHCLHLFTLWLTFSFHLFFISTKHFIIQFFKHIVKLKAFYSEQPHASHLPSIINILLFSFLNTHICPSTKQSGFFP